MTSKKQDPQMPDQLNSKVASRMLSNIFDACDYEANTVPLEVLSTCENYEKPQNLLQRLAAGLMLAVLLMLPVLFVTPHISIERTEEKPGAPTIHVRCDGILPIRKISAMIDDYKVRVQEQENGEFHIFPNRNGKLMVEVMLINRQSAVENVQISGVDVEPPKLLSSEHVGDELTIYFEDDSGRLDFEKIYGKNALGETVYPLRYDPDEMSVTFRYPGDSINIYVQDIYGNVLQLILTVW